MGLCLSHRIGEGASISNGDLTIDIIVSAIHIDRKGTKVHLSIRGAEINRLDIICSPQYSFVADDVGLRIGRIDTKNKIVRIDYDAPTEYYIKRKSYR